MNALISSSKPSLWQSCVHITNNLMKVYNKAVPQLRVFDFNASLSLGQTQQLALHISKQNINNLIFIDHAPNPVILIKCLDYYYRKNNLARPSIHVHIFGDFIYYLEGWKDAEDIIKKFNIVFYGASHKQCRLLEKLIDKENIRLCPFPLDHLFFQYSEPDRNDYRNKLRLKEDENIFLYSGRLSEQKNIDQLLKIFAKINNPKNKLLLAGNFDDIGQPYRRGYRELVGKNFNNIYDFIQASSFLKQNIYFLNDLNITELKSLYSAADCFISLSTYHDEDFGMAVAEAKSCGLPCILSDWAGYSSFNTDSFTKLIKVKFTPEYILINNHNASQEIINFRKTSNKDRKMIANGIANYCGIDTIAALQAKNLNEKNHNFKGFSDLTENLITKHFIEHAIKFTKENSNAFYGHYLDLYDVYY